MSEAETSAAVATPAPAAQPPSMPRSTSSEEFSMTRETFNERQAQARRSERDAVLKELGVDSVDAVKAAIEAKRVADEAKKTEAEKVADLTRRLETERTRALSLESAVKARAVYELSQLDDAKKSAVSAIAGDDAAAQLKAIEALRPTWAQQPATQTAKPLPAPASTTGAGTPPPTGDAPVQPTNYAAVYDDLKVRNPIAAASFYSAYASHIAESRKAAGK